MTGRIRGPVVNLEELIMSRLLRALVPVLALASFDATLAEAGVGIFTVGNGADCPYRDIQAAVDAAAANPGPDYVWIVDDHTYTGEQVLITDTETVVIEGGFSTCDIPTPDSFSTVSGAGNGGGAVFTIRGATNVAFQNLSITSASRDGDASGGGIDFDGTGNLQLINTTIALNSAGYGAGVNFRGESGGATLTVSHDTAILNNTASTSGGGIRIEGQSRLFVLEPNTLIELNHAPNGYGGGIEVLAPAQADIASPGLLGGAVIQFNDALYGGGIAAVGTDEGRHQLATARLFSTDGSNPVQVSNNFASAKGGGIYLKTLAETFFGGNDISTARACLFDYRVDDNVAPDGAAIYADWDTNTALGQDNGSLVYLNGSDTCGPESPTDLGAVPCAADAPCNEMSRNIAADGNAQPTGGAAILVGNDGVLIGDRVILRGSESGTLVTGYTGGYFGSRIELSNCVIADNHTGHELVHLVNGTLHVYNCTLSHNAIDNGYVFYAEDNEDVVVRIIDDIIDEPGVLTLDYPGDPTRVTVLDVLSNDISTLPTSDDIIAGAPSFVDAANGDYHLQPGSLGVDFAPAGTGVDLDRHSRTVDLPDVPNAFGPLDLGAYEIQLGLGCAQPDTVFCDGFESGHAVIGGDAAHR